MIPTAISPFGLGFRRPYKQRLEYIESTGTQYIDTGVKPDFAGGDSLEISFFRPTATEATSIFGSRTNSVTNGVYHIANNINVCDADGYTGVSMTLAGNHTLSVSDTAIVNDATSYSMPRHVTTEFPVYLFALNSGNRAIVNINGGKIYYWKYFQNNVLKQYLIPVLAWNDVPCMYDEITGASLYNGGTGDFLYA